MTDPQLAVYHAQVRWSDADLMGHVNHARYLTFFEDARMEMLARSPHGLGDSVRGHEGGGYIAARVAVDYVAPVEFRPGLTLRVRTGVAKIGTSSWTLAGEMDDDGTVVARCEVVMVAYSYKQDRPRPLDDDERAYWHTFEAQ